MITDSRSTQAITELLPLCQYYAYVEVDPNEDSDLWDVYQEVGGAHRHFAMTRITRTADIYPVFRGLFEHREEEVHA